MKSLVKRAVVVEDSVQFLELIKMVLGNLGNEEIAEATNGKEAIDAIRDGGADVVVMDWKMDIMDGLECTRLIRSGIEGIDPATKIILLTGETGPDAERTAYASGVNLFLEKPFSLKKLHAGVTKVLADAS